MEKFSKLVICFSVIITLVSIPHTKFIYPNLRRIRNSTEIERGAPLYQFVDYLHQKFGERRFTIKDVQNLTGRTYKTIYYKIKFLADVGVLNVEEGRPYYYRFSKQFQDPENIELLVGIREFHKALSEGLRQEEISLIKGKIENLLEAKNNLDISVSKELEGKANELRKKLLIAMSYYGLFDFFNSFSYIRFEQGENEIRYNKADNNITISIMDPNYFISQKVPTLFDWKDKVWKLRRALAMGVFAYGIDLESQLNDLIRDLGLEEEFSWAQALLGINKLGLLVAPRRIGPETGIFYSSELYEDYPFQLEHYSLESDDMSFLETFIANRNKEDIQPLYAKYLTLQGEIVKNIVSGLYKLEPKKRKILILRYFKGMRLETVAKIFNITKERTRQLEINALSSLRNLLKDSLINLQNEIEDVLKEAFNILYGG